MDAPDFEELQWMDLQENYFEEREAQYAEYDDEGDQPLQLPRAAENHAELETEKSIVCRKRRSNDSEEHYKVANGTVQKRGKGEDGTTELCFYDEPMNLDSIENPLEERSPQAPTLDTEGSKTDATSFKLDTSETSANGEKKVPRRRLADIEGDFMPITSPSGERAYSAIKKTERKDTHKLKGSRDACRRSKNGLLSEPFEVLLEQVEEAIVKQACEVTDQQCSIGQTSTCSVAHEQLWVEKYAPKSFTELLSDEQTNREVLRWLKQWDICVFGETKTSTPVDVLTALKRHTTVHQSRRFLNTKNVSMGSEVDSQHFHSEKTEQRSKFSENVPIPDRPFKGKLGNADRSADRPDEKILLLCGPPGLGKTTLAHVAARHCGYRVVEINASDDRVATTLQAKILDAVQMKSVLGEMRPNCVVIDEIDGALGGADGKGAIDALLKIAYSEKKESYGKENDIDGSQFQKGSKRRGSSGATRLSRPIICICNDPFAPALRSLRQMARVHVFAQPSASRVVTRLKYICNLEGYKMNARALTALAEHTECDIRSCLNTLQFLKRKNEPLKMLDIASQVVGRKDMTSSAFDIWGEILQKRKLKNGSAARASTALPEKYGQEQKDFLRRHELMANHGDFDLTSDGVHDNLLHIRYHDSSLQKTVTCLELLGDSEIASHHALRNQHFFLQGYQPSFMLAIRHLIAQPEKPQIEWPRSFQRYRAEHGAKEELLRLWMMNMQPTILRCSTAGCLAWDLVSPFLHILSPQTLRPVAPQLLSHTEREEISQLVDTMIGYGITYKLSKMGAFSEDRYDNHVEPHGLVLDPPIYKFVQFKDYKLGHRVLSLTLRQLLSHEVELETIRRESVARNERAAAITSGLQGISFSEVELEKLPGGLEGKNNHVLDAGDKTMLPTNNDPSKLLACEISTKNVCESINQPGMPSKVEKVNDAALRKHPIDFFAQFRKTSGTAGMSEKDTKASMAMAHRHSRPLLFKFNEGFTNAIRRPMLIRDFL